MIPQNDFSNVIFEILDFVKSKQSFLVLGHQSPDGDCVGSIIGLCAFLRSIGKKAFCVFDNILPDKFDFLSPEAYIYKINDVSLEKFDCVFALDCGSKKRIADQGYLEINKAGVPLVCIDHHQSTEHYGNLNYIDSEASATGELIYYLIQASRKKIDQEIANALFAAIVADTGSFSFANTNQKVLKIAADLLECGADPVTVNENLFLIKSPAELSLISKVIANATFLSGGSIVVSHVSFSDYNILSISPLEDMDSLVNSIRYIRGVKVAVLGKEIEPGKVKISLRSDRQYDVSLLAREMGGGGHRQAAGITLEGKLPDVLHNVGQAVVDMIWKIETNNTVF